jgi:hypothetical protein
LFREVRRTGSRFKLSNRGPHTVNGRCLSNAADGRPARSPAEARR